MRKKSVIGLIVLALAAGALGVWLYSKDRRTLDGKIFVSGNIEATEVDLSFRISGQIDSLPIQEGDRVQKGQTIATLDTDTLRSQKGAAEAEIANARAVLDELEEGTRSEQIDQARAQWKAAESRMKNAKDEFDRYMQLYKEGVVSASTYDARETTLKVATEEYNNALQRLTELERGPREQQIRAASHRWDRAKWELKRIELDIEHSVLTTPVSGVVLVKASELGEVVLPGAPVATVAAIDEVWLKGYVGEQDLGRIKLGQKAEITTDTFPGKVYSGVVTFISPRAEFTPKNVQTKEERVKQVYRTKITIPNREQELKIGMPAEGYIRTDLEPTKEVSGSSNDKTTP
ncbi:MAG TPA: efflux RND transporter periplasmic adaptor subunit [Desulfomonilaceae bacterium]|nr:efflux RND transporter periplasmic adaptor subunit [Desulfomonilaceae bacterium]